MSTIKPGSMPRNLRTVEFQTGTGLFTSAISVGLRVMKYQVKPYDELQATLAAIPQPSDSPTSAAPVMRHKPMNGIPARINKIGMTPGGTMPRVSISTTAAINSVTHGTRNMPTVDISFAVVYWIEETGRLITN